MQDLQQQSAMLQKEYEYEKIYISKCMRIDVEFNIYIVR